jgi:hypothetical protein
MMLLMVVIVVVTVGIAGNVADVVHGRRRTTNPLQDLKLVEIYTLTNFERGGIPLLELWRNIQKVKLITIVKEGGKVIVVL